MTIQFSIRAACFPQHHHLIYVYLRVNNGDSIFNFNIYSKSKNDNIQSSWFSLSKILGYITWPLSQQLKSMTSSDIIRTASPLHYCDRKFKLPLSRLMLSLWEPKRATLNLPANLSWTLWISAYCPFYNRNLQFQIQGLMNEYKTHTLHVILMKFKVKSLYISSNYPFCLAYR